LPLSCRNSSYSAQRWHSLLCLPADLVDATTTFKAVNVWGATYCTIIRTAAMQVNRSRGNYASGRERRHHFGLRRHPRSGTRNRKGERVIGEAQRKTVSVTFDPPVTETVTVVCAQSESEVFRRLPGVTRIRWVKSHGQFLGFGRLHFYGGGVDRLASCKAAPPMKGWGLRERFYHSFSSFLSNGGAAVPLHP